MFSGYPGVLEGIDDFYTTSANVCYGTVGRIVFYVVFFAKFLGPICHSALIPGEHHGDHQRRLQRVAFRSY